MELLDETTIRSSFVNCSKGEAKRLNLPRDPAAVRWDGTAWHSSPLPGKPVYWGFDVAPDSSGTAWDLGADGSVYTNG